MEVARELEDLVVVDAPLHDCVHLHAQPGAGAASIPSSTRLTGKPTSFMARNVSSSSESRLTVTRRSPAAASASAFCGSSVPLVVSATSRPPIPTSCSIRISRSRRRSGSPPVIRIFSTPCADERPRQPLDLLEREQLLPVHEPVAAAEDLLRHAVDAAEVAAVGDRDAKVPERPAEGVDGAHPRSA